MDSGDEEDVGGGGGRRKVALAATEIGSCLSVASWSSILGEATPVAASRLVLGGAFAETSMAVPAEPQKWRYPLKLKNGGTLLNSNLQP